MIRALSFFAFLFWSFFFGIFEIPSILALFLFLFGGKTERKNHQIFSSLFLLFVFFVTFFNFLVRATENNPEIFLEKTLLLTSALFLFGIPFFLVYNKEKIADFFSETSQKISLPEIIFFCSLVALAFFLRLFHLGELSFWWDETITAVRVSDIMEFGIPKHPNEFFVYWRGILYHAIVVLFVSIGEFNEFWVRLPSVFFGLGIIITSFFLARKIDHRISFFVLLFLIFSPFNLEHSQFARFYILNAFLFLLEIFAVWKGFHENKKIFKYLSLILGFLMIHTVQLGQMFILIFFAFGLFEIFQKKSLLKTIHTHLHNIPYAIGALVILVVGNIFDRFFQNQGLLFLFQKNRSLPQPSSWDFFSLPDFSLITFFDNCHIPFLFVFLGIFVALFSKKTFARFLANVFLSITIFYFFFSRGVVGSRIFLLWEPFFVLFGFLGISFFLSFLRFSKISKLSTMTLACFSFLLFSPPFFPSLLAREYGDPVLEDPFRPSSVATFRSDEKGIYEFLKKNKKDGDIWVSVMSTRNPYFSELPDVLFNQNYRYNSTAVSMDKYGNYNDFSGSMLMNTALKLDKFIEKNTDKNIWITVKGSSVNIKGTTHTRPDFIRFLERNKDKIVFHSMDKESVVLLFSKKYENL